MGFQITEFKNNKVHKQLLKLFAGRDVLFLENSIGLHDAVGNLERWLIENKVKYNAIFSIGDLGKLEGGVDYIMERISESDIIVFETTWTYDISKILEKKIAAMKNKKIIVEVYISEPSWWYKPKGVKHDVYVFSSEDEDMDNWDFDKLRLNKPIWEK
jgi:hypothetical protein